MATILPWIIVVFIVVLFLFLNSRKSDNETGKDSQPPPPSSDSHPTMRKSPHSTIESYSPGKQRPLYNTTEAYPPHVIAAKVVPFSLQKQFKKLHEFFATCTTPGRRIITPEFIEVAKAIKRQEQVILVTGGAGTGKTTLIEWLIEQNLAHVVVAFTGAAALNCHGKTIHSFFKFPLGLIDPNRALGPVKEETSSIIKNCHIIVIDEISMVRADLMEAIDRRLREECNNSCPFGGKQLLLVGDPYQLPPVVGNVEKPYFRKDRPECLWQSPWFFDAKIFERCTITHYALTEIFRQSGEEKEYINFLNLARRGRRLDEVINYFNSSCLVTDETRDDVVTITAQNSEATDRNNLELHRLPGELFVSTADCEGAFAQLLHKKIKNSPADNPDLVDDMIKLPAPYRLSLKVGALVMILVNDVAGQFVNGSTGIVKKINIEKSCIDVQLINGNTVAITKYTWESENIEWLPNEKKIQRYVDGTFSQYPLSLAWAITTHKVQGRTLPKAQISYSGSAFQPGQMYVALSRTRSIKDLRLLRSLRHSDFHQDIRLNEWIRTFKKI